MNGGQPKKCFTFRNIKQQEKNTLTLLAVIQTLCGYAQ